MKFLPNQQITIKEKKRYNHPSVHSLHLAETNAIQYNRPAVNPPSRRFPCLVSADTRDDAVRAAVELYCVIVTGVSKARRQERPWFTPKGCN